ncbi:MAG: signal peptidase II [Eubacteriales bacterium]|nr:signal peptidase II [Eubacteriales bacterium]
MLLFWIVAALVLISDQAVKYWVVTCLKPVGDIPVWEGVLHLTYAENTGAAFSMLSGAQWLLIAIAAVAAVGIVWVALRYYKKIGKTGMIALALILGGNIGNLIDRLRFSYVIDYVYVKIINFAIFNLADACLNVGAALLAVYILFFHDKKKKGLNDGTDSHLPR